ncbi:MAG: winged helix-turn-helix transcriptional regulator [Hornefia butyriciproducens]|nr:winged helix-turn-helix transcriptional regulator [Hornefia butyriciproducens]MDD7020622.1 winged helix-turn-helix transcriptional regulator [Hornefia butyriciproducens]MDY2989870.1 winged helix-turn-helix transcriptional regulator [Hornefia butyriciproducens]
MAFCISDIPSLFDGWARIRHAIRVYHKEISENQGNDVVTNVASNEDKVIALLRQDGKMTAKVLAASLGLTQRQVQRILANLKERNKIIRHGASKNGYWEVTD